VRINGREVVPGKGKEEDEEASLGGEESALRLEELELNEPWLSDDGSGGRRSSARWVTPSMSVCVVCVVCRVSCAGCVPSSASSACCSSPSLATRTNSTGKSPMRSSLSPSLSYMRRLRGLILPSAHPVSSRSDIR